MPKTFAEPQAFAEDEYVPIALMPVQSSQVAAVGYSPERKTLAVTFTRGPGHIYHYLDCDAKLHSDFLAAESIGNFFGKHIKSRSFKKYPAPAAA